MLLNVFFYFFWDKFTCPLTVSYHGPYFGRRYVFSVDIKDYELTWGAYDFEAWALNDYKLTKP